MAKPANNWTEGQIWGCSEQFASVSPRGVKKSGCFEMQAWRELLVFGVHDHSLSVASGGRSSWKAGGFPGGPRLSRNRVGGGPCSRVLRLYHLPDWRRLRRRIAR